jgi:hypothetical protein
MSRLAKAYEDMFNPIWYREQFYDEREFAIWCYRESMQDLESHLRVFLDEEMYEDCAIIREVIEYKRSEVLEIT